MLFGCSSGSHPVPVRSQPGCRPVPIRSLSSFRPVPARPPCRPATVPLPSGFRPVPVRIPPLLRDISSILSLSLPVALSLSPSLCRPSLPLSRSLSLISQTSIPKTRDGNKGYELRPRLRKRGERERKRERERERTREGKEPGHSTGGVAGTRPVHLPTKRDRPCPEILKS